MVNPVVITQASASDYDELMRMLLTCFSIQSPNHPPFDVLFPDLYSHTPADMANNFLVRDGTKIVSNVGLFPVFLNLCGRVVEIGGIGGVSTLPEYRGQNLMQTIMDHVQRTMHERGYPFGWLAGDRRRYSPWGYELSSMFYKFHLGSRGPGFGKYVGKLQGKVREGNVDDLDWSTLWRQAQSNPFLTACGEEKLRLKYKRIDQKVIMVDGEQGAHILVHDDGKDRNVRGYAGNPQTLGALLAQKLKTDWPLAFAYLPLHPHAFSSVFDDLMQWFEIPIIGSYAILDLAKTFEVFLPHFNERIAGMGIKGIVRLIMGSARELPRQQVVLEADGRQMHIASDSGLATVTTVELTCMQMSELLFSPKTIGWSSRLDDRAKWLAALMPVPVFFPWIYYV